MKSRPASAPVVCRRRGFTLVELLVAMSITIVLVGLMIQIAANVLGVWAHTSGTLETESEAAVIFDFLTKDLRSMVMKRDGRVWLAATIQGDQTGNGDAAIGVMNNGQPGPVLEHWDQAAVIKPSGQGTTNTVSSSLNIPSYLPPSSATATLTSANMVSLNDPGLKAPSTYRFGQAGVWLRFFTTQPDNSLPAGATSGPPNGQNESVPRAVGYQIARIALAPSDLPGNTSSGSFTYALFRSNVRPWETLQDANASNVGHAQQQSTFGAGYDMFYNFVSGTHSTTLTASYATVTSTPFFLGDASNIRRPNMQQLLGNNVIDFGVRFWGMAYDSSSHNLMPVLLFPISTSNTGFAITTEDGFTRTVGPTGQSIKAIVPPTNFNGSAAANMTYGFSYSSTGTIGKLDTACTPAFCDVFLRILDDEGARLINNLETGATSVPATATSGAAYWWDIAEKHSQVYTRRIELLGSPM